MKNFHFTITPDFFLLWSIILFIATTHLAKMVLTVVLSHITTTAHKMSAVSKTIDHRSHAGWRLCVDDAHLSTTNTLRRLSLYCPLSYPSCETCSCIADDKLKSYDSITYITIYSANRRTVSLAIAGRLNLNEWVQPRW